MKCSMCRQDVLAGAVVVICAFAGPAWAYCSNVHAHCFAELMPQAAYNRVKDMVMKSGWAQLEMQL